MFQLTPPDKKRGRCPLFSFLRIAKKGQHFSNEITMVRLSLLIGTLLVCTTGIAGEMKSPPHSYELTNTVITLRHQTGHQLPGKHEISILGTGKITRQVDGETQYENHLKDGAVIGLLEQFYRINFFKLPNDYTIQSNLHITAEGKVTSSHMRLRDASSEELCAALGEYRKCVRFHSGRSRDLDTLAKDIRSLIE